MSYPHSFQRRFGQEWSKLKTTSDISCRHFYTDSSREWCILRSSERLRWVHYGLGFVIKFPNVICARVADCTFQSKWRWFTLDHKDKRLYQIALPSIFQGQTAHALPGTRNLQLEHVPDLSERRRNREVAREGAERLRSYLYSDV